MGPADFRGRSAHDLGLVCVAGFLPKLARKCYKEVPPLSAQEQRPRQGCLSMLFAADLHASRQEMMEQLKTTNLPTGASYIDPTSLVEADGRFRR